MESSDKGSTKDGDGDLLQQTLIEWVLSTSIIKNSLVAIKIMDINQIKEDYVIRNLYREAKIMSKLNHPCIAALYQTMQRSDNVYYLVTELVAGGDLCSFVKDQRNGKLEERSTRIYGRQFASALSHMHELGIVHRDLKMENVMLNSAQTQIKIVDFGLSNVWSTSNPLKTHCGSPEYAAPELFVPGKQYGAEVDLWSLGIILYGMVLGHLPFVANRGDQLSSQERRRRLVAQINKGLSSTHRRALLCFSHEFRCLMSRLLVAEPPKRMTVRELIAHPWITEKGKKVVRKNPLKPLEQHWHAKIVMDIGVLLQTDPKTVLTATTQEPLGKVGGMYNILAHKHKLSHIPGDGITSTLPSSTVLQYCDYPKVVATASTTKTKTSGSKKLHTSTGVRKAEPRTVSSNARNETPPTSKRRPTTVQNITSSQKNRIKDFTDFKDYRMIKSPSLRRKVYSATIAQKPNKPSSSIERSTRRRNRDSSSERKTHDFDLTAKDRKEIELNELRKTRLMKTGMVAETRTKKLPYTAMKTSETSHVHNVRCKSEHSEYGRISPPPLHLKKSINVERPDRVAVTQSASKTVQRLVTTDDSKHCHSRMSNQIFNKQAPWERAVFAYGDSPVRAVTAPARQGKKYQIYDPIAKCIADYVANNNVTKRLHHYASPKK